FRWHPLQGGLLRLGRSGQSNRSDQVAFLVAERERRARRFPIARRSLADSTLGRCLRTHLRRTVRAVDRSEHAVEGDRDRRAALGDLESVAEGALEGLTILLPSLGDPLREPIETALRG